jgi:hypothetical protein
VVIVTDHARAEAVAEEMAVPAVALIEGLCVPPVQTLHAVGETFEPGLDEQVEVIVEKDPGDAVPGIAANRAAREACPEITVVVVSDDVLPRDAARRDVVNAVGREHGTCLASHEPNLAARCVGARLPG